MESIRIGKDIRVRWPINSSAPLDTLALRLELESPLGVRTEEAFTLEGGSVMFYYPGTRQRDPGTYALTLWANYGAEGQTAVDACHAFRLVGRTCQEAPGGEGLEISTVELPAGELAVGLQGASAYESWLATGHEGTEADFVAWLRQPSVDAAGQAGQAATKALEAAKKATEVAATLQAHDKAWGEADALRVKAETDRQAAETKRQQDTAAAVKSANDAAREASEKVKEASAAATAANEAAGKVDAAIEAAMQAKELLFHDEWDTACGTDGTYNGETGFYELNGLTDITYEQARAIIDAGHIISTYCEGQYANSKIRTNLPIRTGLSGGGGADNGYFCNCLFANSQLEVIRVNNRFRPHQSYSVYGVLFKADKCRVILGVVDFLFVKAVGTNEGFRTFGNALESATIHNVHFNIYLGNCAKLDLPSFTTLVEKANNTAAITITVHPDVYARLTDPSNAEWYAVNTAAQAKNIAFATTE